MRSRDDTFRQVQDLTRIIRSRVRGGVMSVDNLTAAGRIRALVRGAARATGFFHRPSTCPTCPLRWADARIMHISTAPTTALREEEQKKQEVQMKFRCDRDDLSEALQTVQRGVSSRPGIPALTGVLLEAAEDGTLTLTTTDLEVSARLTIGVQVQEAGTAGAGAAAGGHGEVPVGGARGLRDGPVAGAHPLRRVRRCAAAPPADDFPGVQEPSGTVISVDPAAFSEAVGQVARGVARRGAARPDRGSSRSAGRAWSWSRRTRTGWRCAISSRRRTARRRRSCRSALTEAGRAATDREGGGRGVRQRLADRVPGGHPHADVAPDRGRVPELPTAPAGGARAG